MATKLELMKQRVKAGSWDDVIEGAWARYVDGGRESILDAWTDQMTDMIIKRYEAKIRAMFARAGVEIASGEELDKAWLCNRISETLGVEVNDISPEAITGAIDKSLAHRLSEVIGMPVTTVFDMEKLKGDVSDGVKAALADGRAADLIFDSTVKAARRFATWKRNADGLNKKAVQNHAGQKRYRRTHKMVWQ